MSPHTNFIILAMLLVFACMAFWRWILFAVVFAALTLMAVGLLEIISTVYVQHH